MLMLNIVCFSCLPITLECTNQLGYNFSKNICALKFNGIKTLMNVNCFGAMDLETHIKKLHILSVFICMPLATVYVTWLNFFATQKFSLKWAHAICIFYWIQIEVKHISLHSNDMYFTLQRKIYVFHRKLT